MLQHNIKMAPTTKDFLNSVLCYIEEKQHITPAQFKVVADIQEELG